MKKFKILSRNLVVDEKYCQIEKQKVKLPNGETADWFIRQGRDAVIVVPQKENGEILLQKNYKHGCGEIVTEFPAGLCEANENVIQTAQRELLEETGYEAKKIFYIGQTYLGPTGSKLKRHFFLAKIPNAPKSQQTLDGSEQIEVFFVENLAKAEKILLQKKAYASTDMIAAIKFVENFVKTGKSLNI